METANTDVRQMVAELCEVDIPGKGRPPVRVPRTAHHRGQKKAPLVARGAPCFRDVSPAPDFAGAGILYARKWR